MNTKLALTSLLLLTAGLSFSQVDGQPIEVRTVEVGVRAMETMSQGTTDTITDNLFLFANTELMEDLVSVRAQITACLESHCEGTLGSVEAGVTMQAWQGDAFPLAVYGVVGVGISLATDFRKVYVGIMSLSRVGAWQVSLEAMHHRDINGSRDPNGPWTYTTLGLELSYSWGPLELLGGGMWGWNETGQDLYLRAGISWEFDLRSLISVEP